MRANRRKTRDFGLPGSSCRDPAAAAAGGKKSKRRLWYKALI
jgi:hypothetical protein